MPPPTRLSTRRCVAVHTGRPRLLHVPLPSRPRRTPHAARACARAPHPAPPRVRSAVVKGEYTVYCGQLPADIRARELDDLFGRYGRIRDIDVKPSRGGAFAFSTSASPAITTRRRAMARRGRMDAGLPRFPPPGGEGGSSCAHAAADLIALRCTSAVAGPADRLPIHCSTRAAACSPTLLCQRLSAISDSAYSIESFPVEFEDDRDADEAAYRLDNFRFDGRPLRVELKRGGGRRGPGGAHDDPRDRDRDSGRGGGGGYGMSRDERRERDRAGGARATVAAAKRTPWTARLLGLPVSTSWQDVKDFVRQVAPAKFANVFKEGGEVIGEADFESEADLDNIISRLDGADFKNPFDTVKVTVERVKPSAPAPRADEGEDKRRREDDMDAEDTRRREDDVDAEEAIEDAAAKEEEKPAVEEEAPQEEPAEEAAAPADE